MFIFTLIMNSLIPVMMIVFGTLWKKYPPKKVNWVYGYRTLMSMKNDETWEFAHMHHAKIWRWVGLVWLIISTIMIFLFKDNYENTLEITMLIGLAIMFLSLIPTEIILRKKFDKNGKQREENEREY